MAHGVTGVISIVRTRGDDGRIEVDSTTIAVVEGVGSGTGVADLAITAIFGRELVADTGVNRMRTRLLEISRSILI